jgi:hypothetical protein
VPRACRQAVGTTASAMGSVKQDEFCWNSFFVRLVGLRLLGKEVKACSQTPGGEVGAAGARQGKSSGAGAQPESGSCRMNKPSHFIYEEVGQGFLGRFLFGLPRRALFTSKGQSAIRRRPISLRRACIVTYSGHGRGTSTLNLQIGLFCAQRRCRGCAVPKCSSRSQSLSPAMASPF